MKKIRFALAGCGTIHEVHARAIESNPGAELAAVCDADADKAQNAAARYGAAPYTDYERMLSHPGLDAVSICTPSGLHVRQAAAAMRAGKHAIVEKPLGIALPEIDEALRIQRERGVKLAVVSQHRWDAGVRRTKELAEHGLFGRIAMVNCYTQWYRTQEYYDKGGWRGTWAMDGGGALMNQSIHYIDLLLWIGGPVRSVVGRCAALAHRIETEDTAAAVVRFQSGALGTIQGTTSAYPGLKTRLEVLGDGGSAVIENDRLVYLHLAGRPEENLDWAADPGASGGAADPAAIFGAAHREQYADFLAALAEDREPMVNGEEGRRAVAIILALYESSRTGREVEFAEPV